MKTIPLTQGQHALVDDADFDNVDQFKWYAKKATNGRTFYAARQIRISRRGKQQTVMMHQFLLAAKPGDKVDHRDGDGLNNLRRNIRLCSHIQNMQGFRRKKIGAASQYVGVYWHNQSEKWMVQVKIDGQNQHVGMFDSEVEAARAYDAAALTRNPQFCNLNFPK